MGYRIRLETEHESNGELISALAESVDNDSLMLFSTSSIPDGAWVAFEVALADGSLFLEGMGRCQGSSTDGGGHMVLLGMLQFDTKNQLVFDRLLLARDDFDQGGRLTGTIDISQLVGTDKLSGTGASARPAIGTSRPPPHPEAENVAGVPVDDLESTLESPKAIPDTGSAQRPKSSTATAPSPPNPSAPPAPSSPPPLSRPASPPASAPPKRVAFPKTGGAPRPAPKSEGAPALPLSRAKPKPAPLPKAAPRPKPAPLPKAPAKPSWSTKKSSWTPTRPTNHDTTGADERPAWKTAPKDIGPTGEVAILGALPEELERKLRELVPQLSSLGVADLDQAQELATRLGISVLETLIRED